VPAISALAVSRAGAGPPERLRTGERRSHRARARTKGNHRCLSQHRVGDGEGRYLPEARGIGRRARGLAAERAAGLGGKPPSGGRRCLTVATNTNAPAAADRTGREHEPEEGPSLHPPPAPRGPAGRLKPATADELARALFDGTPGAAELLLELWNGSDDRRRDRCRRALRALDPRRTVVEDLAHDVATLLVAIVYGAEPDERRRIAWLLQSVCAEAARIGAAA
jgi:hypothetical protein